MRIRGRAVQTYDQNPTIDRLITRKSKNNHDVPMVCTTRNGILKNETLRWAISCMFHPPQSHETKPKFHEISLARGFENLSVNSSCLHFRVHFQALNKTNHSQEQLNCRIFSQLSIVYWEQHVLDTMEQPRCTFIVSMPSTRNKLLSTAKDSSSSDSSKQEMGQVNSGQ